MPTEPSADQRELKFTFVAEGKRTTVTITNPKSSGSVRVIRRSEDGQTRSTKAAWQHE